MYNLADDVGVSKDILPPGLSDINGQQLDLRKTNSWLLTMGEVSTPEGKNDGIDCSKDMNVA